MHELLWDLSIFKSSREDTAVGEVKLHIEESTDLDPAEPAISS